MGNGGRTYTLTEATARIGLGAERLRVMASKGQLPLAGEHHPGQPWLLDADQIDAMVNSGKLRRLRTRASPPAPQPAPPEDATGDPGPSKDSPQGDTGWALAEARIEELEREIRRLRRIAEKLQDVITAGLTPDDPDQAE